MDHQSPILHLGDNDPDGFGRFSRSASISKPCNCPYRVTYSTGATPDPPSTLQSSDNVHCGSGPTLDSVIRIDVESSSPNRSLPWHNKMAHRSSGSGFVVREQRIITNAHVVADHTFIRVKKRGSPALYRAHVLSVGHECDLAILGVNDQEFWKGMSFLELGDVPSLQDAITVVGYPQGGKNISITKGVVSRIELTQYAHGMNELLAIQIDAPTNPGNSGGPALNDGKVVGVAFQSLIGSENIG